MKLIILGLIVTVGLNAGWKKGSDLVSEMDEYIKSNNGVKHKSYKDISYISYVHGVSDTLADAGYVCYPDNVNVKQILEIVKKFIQDNPKEWNKQASFLVQKPLIDTFPCKNKK